MSPGPVWTVAIWDFQSRLWRAFATSSRRELVEALHGQCALLLLDSVCVVEVALDDDDAIVAALSKLAPIADSVVFERYSTAAALCDHPDPDVDGLVLH